MRHAKTLLLILLALLLAAGAFAAPAPTEDLRKSIDEVISYLGNRTLDRTARRAEVVKIIRAKFDFDAMGRFILGTYWRELTPADRVAFVERFGQILENTYMNRIESYTDEKVKYGEEKRADDKARVATLVVSKTKEIPVDYKVYLKGEAWFVYDVTIEGVSLVRNFQETYTEVYRKNGMPGLLKKMDERIVELKNAKGPK